MYNKKNENFKKQAKFNNNLHQEQTQQLSITLESKSHLESNLQIIPLEESKNKSIFLAKVALLFVGLFTFINIEILYIKSNPDETRLQYVHSKLELLSYVYIVLTLSIKIIFSLFGTYIRNLAPLVYLIDFYLTYMVVLGLYYKLSITGVFQTSNQINIVQLISYIMLFTFIGFLLSTVYQDKKKNYNPFIGLMLMIFTQIIAFTVFKYYNHYKQISSYFYIKTFVICLVVDFYISFNTYFIINYRTSLFYENDVFYCYNCFWGDWINVFWTDVIKTTEQLKEENRQTNLDNKIKLRLSQSQELQSRIRDTKLRQTYLKSNKKIKVSVKPNDIN